MNAVTVQHQTVWYCELVYYPSKAKFFQRAIDKSLFSMLIQKEQLRPYQVF